MTDELVHVQQAGAVCTLTLDSPHNRNALSSQLLDELEQGLRDATSDSEVRMVVITGKGSAFCSGADLSERSTAISARMPELLTMITTCHVPVVVRVNGHARAGGLGLIAAADMAVATSAATFAFSEVRVGVAPAMILVPALRVMEPRFLRRMVLTADVFGAEEAAEAGLISEVVEDEASLTAWVDGVVASILKAAPGAVAATKSLLRSLPNQSWIDGLHAAQRRSAELFAGAEAAEGMDAFLNKRKPWWDVNSQ